MKKFIIVIISFFLLTVGVKADTLTSITGEKNLIINHDGVYVVKIKAEGVISRLNITYSVSDNLKVEKVEIGKSFSRVSASGNNYVLSSNVNEGNVFNITVRGNNTGGGKIRITKCIATINGEDVNLLESSFDINVISNDALDRAKRLVDKAVATLDRIDYENALNSVKGLTSKDDLDKNELMNKLNEISDKLLKDDTRVVCDDNSKAKKIWMYLSIGLLVCLVAESSYIIYLKEK